MEKEEKDRSKSASKNGELTFPQSKKAKKKKRHRGWLRRHVPQLILLSIAVNLSLLLFFTDVVPQILRALESHTEALNITRLNYSLHSAIVGQDQAINVVIDEISKYLNSTNNYSPLMLSIHGGSGTGKTKLTDILVQHVTPPCVKKFVLPSHFLKVNENETRDKIFKTILVDHFHCSFRLIIFEEIDYASAPLISSLRECFDAFTREHLSLPKTIILFTSRVGESAISEFVINLLQSGVKRRDISFKRMTDLVLFSAIADQNPWTQFLISHKNNARVITFLPLEKRHVIHCITSRLNEQGVESFSLIERILADISFVPKLNPVIAEKGCKQIHSHVHYYGNL